MMDFPVLDDMAEEAYQMQHWRTKVKVAREEEDEGRARDDQTELGYMRFIEDDV
jgi:hypothetical protein